MNADIALIVALALPAVLFMALRMNAAMVFLSLCLGEVMVLYVASAAADMLKGSFPGISPISTSTMQIIVLLVPAIVTAVLTSFSIHGKIKNIGNFFPAVGAAALAVLLSVPLLPVGVRLQVQTSQTWQYLSNAEALIIGVGGVVSLMFLWTQRHHFKKQDKRKH